MNAHFVGKTTGTVRLAEKLRAWGLALAALSIPLLSGPAFAEGTRTVFPSGTPGARAPMDVVNNATYAGVARNRMFVYVYARAGEYIYTGSSNRNNGGDVFIYNPQSFGARGNETIPGAADYTCSTSNLPPASYGGAGRGVIATRAAELAGPNSADGSATVTDGWSPCAYLAPSTGIYGVRFSGATAGFSALVATPVANNPQILQDRVAAWEVVVRASNATTTDLAGRAFTYAWVGRSGDNGAAARLNHVLHYITEDGYRYRQTLNDLDPFAYALYANRAGFLDTGSPLYKSVRGNNQTATTLLPAGSGISAQAPQYPIFFADVSDAGPNDAEVERVLGALGIPSVPPVPQLSAVSFTGTIGGSTTALGGGGVFQFNTVNTLTYQIVISRDGVDFDPANTLNRVLTGTALTGSHSVFWDGRDNAGNLFPLGSGYTYRIDGRNGEVHFPIIDTEGMAFGGPTVLKRNGSQDATIYYDDRGYRTRNNTLVGELNGHLCGVGHLQVQPSPVQSLIGVDSSDGNLGGSGFFYRRYPQVTNDPNNDCTNTAATHFGTAKGLDSWALERTPIISQTLDIVPPIVGADPGTLVTVTPSAFPGQTVFGTIVYLNNGDVTATGTAYTAVIGTPGNCPTSVNFTLLPTGVTAAYNNATCVVTFTGMPANLPASSISPPLTINFNYPAPATGPIPVNTTISAANEVAGATAPNSASASTVIVLADVTADITVPAAVAPGATVNGSVQFTNAPAAGATANGVVYQVTIGTPGSCPAGIDFPGIAPATFSVDTATCVVSFSGLDTQLDPGEALNLNFTYTAPLSGSVPVAANISTTTPESTTANNSDTGSTLVAIADMSASFGPIPAVVSPGQTLVGRTLTCTNGGPNQALAATCVPSVDVGSISNLSCVPPTPVASLANGSSITCTFDYTAPGTPGGSDTGPTAVNFTGTTGATNDSNSANNADTDAATIIDALDDTTTLLGGATGQTFNLATNDQFPIGSTFSIQPGGTCANASVSAAGVATFDVVPSPCTVNYQVCAPAP
ncbi:MAG: hypothetical protein DYH17_00880, partial [Xanthomonadales bacterium PRO6]|nr:hypothetical protein [Xanthomonadales bacterium PRO6]